MLVFLGCSCQAFSRINFLKTKGYFAARQSGVDFAVIVLFLALEE